jgi:hypothetical protein
MTTTEQDARRARRERLNNTARDFFDALEVLEDDDLDPNNRYSAGWGLVEIGLFQMEVASGLGADVPAGYPYTRSDA